MDCVFCKIVNGELPSKKIYEDESVLAFLDIKPVSEGHTLVIPKKHSENILDTEDQELEKVMKIVKKVAKQRIVEGATGIKVVQSNGRSAGQEVFHIHFHVIPAKKS